MTPSPRVLEARWLGTVSYEAALAEQEALVAAKVGGEQRDFVLLLEHPPVYTLGRGADAADLREAAGGAIPVVRVSRGGGVTFHGPGQLVAYPIVALASHGRDVHRYVRTLEQCVVEVCRAYGAPAAPRPGLTGVWADGAKLASIGIGVRRGVAYHGIAVNVTSDLSAFERVIPCRLPDVTMVNLARWHTPAPSVREVGRRFADRLAAALEAHLVAP